LIDEISVEVVGIHDNRDVQEEETDQKRREEWDTQLAAEPHQLLLAHLMCNANHLIT